MTDRPPAPAPRTSRVLLVAALLLYLAGAAGSLAGLRWQIPLWGAVVFGGLRVAGLGAALGGALARRYGPAATTGALLALSLLCLAIPVDLFAVPAAISRSAACASAMALSAMTSA